MMLSILIPTTSDRKDFYNSLMANLSRQVKNLSDKDGIDYWREVQILKDPRGEEFSIGEKRNALLKTAEGKYVCFFDDDDRPSEDYLEMIIEGIRYNPDCLSLRGIMTTDGINPEVFEHSLKYNEWKTTENEVKYERYPNHLNVIRADIAKRFKFPEISMGEDHDWSTQVFKSGLLKKEFYIDKVLYHYQYRTIK